MSEWMNEWMKTILDFQEYENHSSAPTSKPVCVFLSLCSCIVQQGDHELRVAFEYWKGK